MTSRVRNNSYPLKKSGGGGGQQDDLTTYRNGEQERFHQRNKDLLHSDNSKSKSTSGEEQQDVDLLYRRSRDHFASWNINDILKLNEEDMQTRRRRFLDNSLESSADDEAHINNDKMNLRNDSKSLTRGNGNSNEKQNGNSAWHRSSISSKTSADKTFFGMADQQQFNSNGNGFSHLRKDSSRASAAAAQGFDEQRKSPAVKKVSSNKRSESAESDIDDRLPFKASTAAAAAAEDNAIDVGFKFKGIRPSRHECNGKLMGNDSLTVKAAVVSDKNGCDNKDNGMASGGGSSSFTAAYAERREDYCYGGGGTSSSHSPPINGRHVVKSRNDRSRTAREEYYPAKVLEEHQRSRKLTINETTRESRRVKGNNSVDDVDDTERSLLERSSDRNSTGRSHQHLSSSWKDHQQSNGGSPISRRNGGTLNNSSSSPVSKQRSERHSRPLTPPHRKFDEDSDTESAKPVNNKSRNRGFHNRQDWIESNRHFASDYLRDHGGRPTNRLDDDSAEGHSDPPTTGKSAEGRSSSGRRRHYHKHREADSSSFSEASIDNNSGTVVIRVRSTDDSTVADRRRRHQLFRSNERRRRRHRDAEENKLGDNDHSDGEDDCEDDERCQLHPFRRERDCSSSTPSRSIWSYLEEVYIQKSFCFCFAFIYARRAFMQHAK